MDNSGSNAGERLADEQAAPSAASIPVVTRQHILQAGLNVFGLDLFIESVAGKVEAKTFAPFTFRHRGIEITLKPVGEVDTRHY